MKGRLIKLLCYVNLYLSCIESGVWGIGVLPHPHLHTLYHGISGETREGGVTTCNEKYFMYIMQIFFPPEIGTITKFGDSRHLIVMCL